MKLFQVEASTLNGHITVPTSKSHTMRAILFASLAKGQSRVESYLRSPDAQAMISACRKFGANIQQKDDFLLIDGVAGKLMVPDDVINAGNSGQVLRFIGAVAGLIDRYTVITGDPSIRHNRPAAQLLSGLRQLGAMAESSRGDDFAPLIIRGPIKAGRVEIEGVDSQPVTGLLIAASLLEGTTSVTVKNPGERPWIDVTLGWFDRLGVKYSNNDYRRYQITGKSYYEAFQYTVPGDFSSIAFPIVAALITGSEITVGPVDMSDTQGDKKLFPVLETMGAEFEYDEKKLSLKVKPCHGLTGREININDFIDALPILAVIGCFAAGETHITGAKIARMKECDRIHAICAELQKMEANIEEHDDGLVVRQSKLQGAWVESYRDHRIAMALSVAAMIAEGRTSINDIDCVDKSFPGFMDTMVEAGMLIRVEHT